jgi:hypothetical protein
MVGTDFAMIVLGSKSKSRLPQDRFAAGEARLPCGPLDSSGEANKALALGLQSRGVKLSPAVAVPAEDAAYASLALIVSRIRVLANPILHPIPWWVEILP